MPAAETTAYILRINDPAKDSENRRVRTLAGWGALRRAYAYAESVCNHYQMNIDLTYEAVSRYIRRDGYVYLGITEVAGKKPVALLLLERIRLNIPKEETYDAQK